ncbi:MAG: ABC-2 family transporter protein [Candidatus Dojkabacteria bacterium]|nr:ABC-2 family transporter protein [Candidatus Dojkabacteria bacterium]
MSILLTRIKKLIRQNFLPENRVQTISEIIAVLVWMASTVIFYYVLQDIFPEQEFWKGANFASIIASFFIVDGLLFSFLFRNLFELSEQIESRKIDQRLLMPVGFKSYSGFRKMQFSSLIQIPVSIVLIILTIRSPIPGFLFWTGSLIIGYLIAYHLWYILSLLSFWIKIGEKSTFLFEEFSLISMFPAAPFIASKLYFFFFPFLTFASFSAKGLLEGGWERIYIMQSAVLLVFVFTAKILEYLGIKRYRA